MDKEITTTKIAIFRKREIRKTIHNNEWWLKGKRYQMIVQIKKISIISIVLLFGFYSIAFAEIIYLKNGGRLDGKIVKENKDNITLQLNIGTMTIERSKIDKIEEMKYPVEPSKEVVKAEEEKARLETEKQRQEREAETARLETEERKSEKVLKDEVAPDRKSQIIDYLANTKYIYRNMSADYVELSVYYSYCYENADFIGWEVVADSNNPVAVLATAKFKISGVPSDILNAPENEVSYSTKEKMKEATPLLKITWRVNDLIGLKITPYNFYAEDALVIYQEMVTGVYKLAQ